MNYIDRDDLLMELRNSNLRSYFASNLLDDSLFYPIIDYCLSILKVKTQKYKSQVVKIDNFKGGLPEDFFKLQSIVKGESYNFTYTNPVIQVDYEPVMCHEKKCNPPLVHCDGSKYYLTQRFEDYNFSFNNIVPLSIHHSSKNSCSNLFKNIGQEKVSIENGFINTEFRNGFIYITYESNENDGLIPDYPKVKEAIKTICLYRAFEIMFLNGEQDLSSRLGYLQPQMVAAENILRLVAKEQGFNDIMKWRNVMVSRFNVFDKLTKPTNGY